MLGSGILKGLAETAKNFVGSYIDESGLTTIEYPDERQTLAENTRQFPFLVFDGDDAMKGLRCVSCQICEKECPPQCIFIVKSKDKKPDHVGKPQFYPATFDIDLSVCMSCQICVEVCPFEAIKMDTEFELSTSDRFGQLLLHKGQLAKPNSHFQEIHPTDAAVSDAALAADKAKAEAKAAADAKAKAEAGIPRPLASSPEAVTIPPALGPPNLPM
ncbi:MAG: 4Fe-4S dicluster domain-containing protein [Pedosphaera sp.]|nr:4Fe-4S dicluster domain-containing protein [Pedosphaera sp.]